MTHQSNRGLLWPAACSALALLAAALWATPVHAATITIDTVPVGNAGNLPDQLYPDLFFNPDNLQFGAVGYNYRIGKYEVTNAQYAEFLNFKAASDPLGLYSTSMGSDGRGGITRSGADGNYTYTTKPNMGNKPVNYVNWYDAIRFANWLHNGQGSGDTETGAYTLLGGTPVPSDANSITRNPNAKWWLPSEDEWYKAAYYDPTLNSGAGGYWLYPTQSNTAPTIATANSVGDISNPGANVANRSSGAFWNGLNGNVTTVGSAGPLSDSFYGTADQGGNVSEWIEARMGSSGRGKRGGQWDGTSSFSLAGARRSSLPTFESDVLGFRVATLAVVPEPSTAVLAILGCLSLLSMCVARKRRRLISA